MKQDQNLPYTILMMSALFRSMFKKRLRGKRDQVTIESSPKAAKLVGFIFSGKWNGMKTKSASCAFTGQRRTSPNENRPKVRLPKIVNCCGQLSTTCRIIF